MGILSRIKLKLNYFTMMGFVAGTYTDPPLLGFANQVAGNDAPAVGYSTVYPLAMFLRILTAQLPRVSLRYGSRADRNPPAESSFHRESRTVSSNKRACRP